MTASVTPPVTPKMTPAPGVVAERSVGLFIRERGEVDAGLLDHVAQLARRDDEVDEPLAVLLKLGARSLELLAGAGHDGHGIDVLTRKLLADERAEHRHRGCRKCSPAA